MYLKTQFLYQITHLGDDNGNFYPYIIIAKVRHFFYQLIYILNV